MMAHKIDYVEYNPEILAQLHSTLLGMLKDFIVVCEKNNIEYFATGGTALGAVRHRGMIPWDDDIDIAYRRSDEERIINLITEEYGDKYWFINPEIDSSFPYLPTHMCLKGTVYKEKIFPHEHRSGVFLDLYPFDDVYNDERRRKRQVLKAWFWGKLYIMYFATSPVLYYEGWKANLVRFGCKLGKKIMHLFRVPPSALHRKAMKYGLECSQTGASSHFFMWLHSPSPFTSLVKKDDVFPTRKMPFEDFEIRVPRKVEECLEASYGNYMTLPPKEKRHNHPPATLIL